MSQDLFNEKDEEELSKPAGKFLKIKDFEGAGLVVKIAQPAQREKADEGFGDRDGMTNIYSMELQSGEVMELSSASRNLARALIDAHIQVGDWARIKMSKNEKDFPEFEVTKIVVENEKEVDTAKEFEAAPDPFAD